MVCVVFKQPLGCRHKPDVVVHGTRHQPIVLPPMAHPVWMLSGLCMTDIGDRVEDISIETVPEACKVLMGPRIHIGMGGDADTIGPDVGWGFEGIRQHLIRQFTIGSRIEHMHLAVVSVGGFAGGISWHKVKYWIDAHQGLSRLEDIHGLADIIAINLMSLPVFDLQDHIVVVDKLRAAGDDSGLLLVKARLLRNDAGDTVVKFVVHIENQMSSKVVAYQFEAS